MAILKNLKIRMLNVLSLYQPGALKMLLEQLDRYKLDITAFQEMRLIGEGVIEKKDKLFLQLSKERPHIRNRLIMDFKAKSSRMCRFRIRGNCCFIIVSYVYMPQLRKRMRKKNMPFMMTWIRPMRSALGGMSK
jgi:exonuclease III